MILKYFLTILITFLFISSDKKEKTTQDPRPNIIYIMADDHALQAISAYGHPISKLAPTPNIDRIAGNGALFINNFCANSICGPSRASVITGKFSHENGFRMNGNKFDGSQPTLPKYLQKSGYKTAMIGKWHLDGQPQGFDHWDILDDQGNYYNPDFITAKDTITTEGYATDLITDKSLAWLDQSIGKDAPFFLMMHHKAPHRNWMPALRHLNKYDDTKFPLPYNYFSQHDNPHAAKEQLQTIYRDMYEGHDLKMTKKEGSPELAHNPWTKDFDRMTKEQRAIWDKAYQEKNDAMHRAKLSGKALAEWKFQRYVQEYMATIASVDESIGRVLDYLDKHNLTENTIVVYTSDQGFYMGENGWFDKRFMYDISMKMPLLIQYPKKIQKGIQIEDMTQNIDFAETFLDYAKVEIPKDMQGKSFRPLLEKPKGKEEFRDAVYYHYYDYPAFHMVKKHYGVRTKRYKLMHFYDDIDSWEMYDMKVDPDEQHNIISDPKYADVKKELLSRLKSLQTQYGVTEKEFEKASPESVRKNYENFKRLRGNPMQ